MNDKTANKTMSDKDNLIRDSVSTTSDLPNLYTVAQVAKYLQVSTKTVRRSISSGNLGVVSVSRQIRIVESELKRYLQLTTK